MSGLKDSSELAEAAELLRSLVGPAPAGAERRASPSVPLVPPTSGEGPREGPTDGPTERPLAARRPAMGVRPVPEPSDGWAVWSSTPTPGKGTRTLADSLERPSLPAVVLPRVAAAEPRADPALAVQTRERVERLLWSLCERGGHSAALVTKCRAAPLATHGSPVVVAELARIAERLREALEQAGRGLGPQTVDELAAVLSDGRRLVVRRVLLRGHPYDVALVSPLRDVDRGALDGAVAELERIVGRW